MEEPARKPSDSKRLAAIDIGSNSIRLLVAEATADGTYQVLDDEKQTTRLAHGLATNGRLTPEAVEQSLDALKRMKTIADGYGVERMDVIATSAVREAQNRADFVEAVSIRLGINIEVISTQEEGRLSFVSAARHFDLKKVDAVVVDLGGGSVEMILAAKGVVEQIHSLPLGAVRMTEAFLNTDPPTAIELALLKKNVRKRVGDAVKELDFTPHFMIGAGGTFTALAQIAMRRRANGVAPAGGFEMNRTEVRHIFDALKDMPLQSRRGVQGLNADRADIILAGVAVVEQLMKYFRVNRLLIHDKGVRDGLLLRMIGKVFKRSATVSSPDADPLAGVKQFAAACGYEVSHAQQVAKLSLELFDQLAKPLQLPADERFLLEAAAILHEVGCMIHYEKHHQHSYHLIMHGNLRGLSSHQRELVANIARYHRRSGPKMKHENFARLKPADQVTVRRMSALLRLADGLDRTHMQRIRKLNCFVTKTKMTLTLEADGVPDVDVWGAEEKGKLFKKVFGLKVKVAVEAKPPEKAKQHAKPHTRKYQTHKTPSPSAEVIPAR